MPNGEDRKLKFVVKVRDPETDEFKPIYIAPDATDKVRGDVKLSDAIDSDLNAAEGMTAATPKAVKDAMAKVNKKVDKESEDPQSVASDLTINGKLSTKKDLTVDGKATIGQGADITGSLTVSNNLSVTGSETVTGKLNANGGLTVVGETNVGNVTSTGSITSETVTVNDTLDVTGNTTVGGDISTSGSITAEKDITTNGNLNAVDVKASGNVDVTGQMTVTGTSQFSDLLSAEKGVKVPEGQFFEGNLQGTAAKATQLDIEEDVGSKIEPVYFSGGKPVACGDYLGVTVVSESKPEEEHVLFWIEPEESDKRLEG